MYLPLYNEKEIKKIKRLETLLWILITAFGICAAGILCYCMMFTNSLNAVKTETAGIIAVTCYGWAAMLLLVFFLLPLRREHAHAKMLSREKGERIEGPFSLESTVIRIPNSIVIRKIKCGERRISVIVSRVSKLLSFGEISAVYAVNGYVAAVEKAEGNENATTNVVESKTKRSIFPEIKRFLATVPAMIIWLLLAIFAVGFFFNFVTDTKAEKKVSVYIDVADMKDRQLEYELSQDPLPAGIRMVKVHPFSYAMFGDEDLLHADLYIIPASKIDLYRESLDGEGIPVYDCVTEEGVRSDLIDYSYVDTDEEGNAYVKEEDYYLFFGTNSLHNSAEDRAAQIIAERYLGYRLNIR